MLLSQGEDQSAFEPLGQKRLAADSAEHDGLLEFYSYLYVQGHACFVVRPLWALVNPFVTLKQQAVDEMACESLLSFFQETTTIVGI
jgi:hypothetical protein